jgi:hypothetical protein
MKAMADLLGVPATTYYGWFKTGSEKAKPSAVSVEKMLRFLSGAAQGVGPGGDAPQARGPEGPASTDRSPRERTQRIKKLLILLESELSAFRDGPRSGRDVFRAELDPDDVGYLSSLLTMLGDENKFTRWRDLTTNRFRHFGKKKRDEG